MKVPAGQKYFLPESEYTRRKATDTIAIHCSQTNRKQNFTADDIREWHVNENGWKDIGYNLVIRRDGTIEEGRPLWAVGAHVEGHNSTSIGICMIGGCNAKSEEENNFTDEQWASLLKLVKGLVQNFNITTIKGHREFPKVKKYCPSFDVQSWLKQNRKALHDDVSSCAAP